jgi:hypothetical protein
MSMHVTVSKVGALILLARVKIEIRRKGASQA